MCQERIDVAFDAKETFNARGMITNSVVQIIVASAIEGMARTLTMFNCLKTISRSTYIFLIDHLAIESTDVVELSGDYGNPIGDCTSAHYASM